MQSLAAAVDVTLEIRVGIRDVDLRAEYERARVMAYLARGEPFGLAALEAQACGCPVVVSAEGGLPETIIDGVTGYAVPRDPDAVGNAIDRLCQPETSLAAQTAAADHARARSWAISAARVQDILSDLLARRSR